MRAARLIGLLAASALALGAGAVAGAAQTTPTTTTHASPPPGSSCGQTITVQPTRVISPGRPPLAIGDSVLYDAARALANYGFESNAMICRTMGQGIVWLEQNSTNLPSLVVVALGTNGAVTEAQIEQLLTILGPQRLLALVTPHHGNYAYVAGLYRSAAQHNPGRIDLLDWDAFSAGHADWFAPDGIHLGSATGVDAFAQLVASALLGGPVTATPQPTQRRPPRPRSHRPSAPRAASQTPTQANPGTVTTWLQLFGEIEAYCLVLPRS